MTLPDGMLLACAFSTFALAGLIWTVQLVHYPAFAYVREDDFAVFAAFHQGRISYAVVPLMLVELVTAAALVWRPGAAPLWAAIAGAILVAIIWASTFLIQVPLHTRLSRGYDAEAIRMLVATNWIRTIAWSARAVLLGWCLTRLIGGDARA